MSPTGRSPSKTIKFTNHQKNQLGRKGTYWILKKYVDKARNNGAMLPEMPITCHVLRHSETAHMLQAGIWFISVIFWGIPASRLTRFFILVFSFTNCRYIFNFFLTQLVNLFSNKYHETQAKPMHNGITIKIESKAPIIVNSSRL